MFEIPVSQVIEGVSGFWVKLTNPVLLNIRLELRGQIVPDLKVQQKFMDLQNSMLNELTKHTHMFKTPPKLEALQSITPNWGFVILNGKPEVSSYTKIQNEIPEADTPAWIDLVFEGFLITRSTIRPLFKTKFLEKISGSAMIDFEWGTDATEPEVAEITDMEMSPGAPIHLKDPKELERQKRAAKQAVRAALREAQRLHDVAQEHLNTYLETYDMSDSESVFTDVSSDGED